MIPIQYDHGQQCSEMYTGQSILAKALSSSLLNLFRPVARHIEWGVHMNMPASGTDNYIRMYIILYNLMLH